MRHTTRAAALAAVVLTLTSGCGLFGGGDDENADDQPASEQTIDPDRLSPTDLPEVPEIEDGDGAIKDVKIGDCPTKKGANSVKGTLENPTDEAVDYVITISWITPRSDVVARGVETIEDVAPGASEKFTVKGSDIAQDGTYSCTTNVMRGQL